MMKRTWVIAVVASAAACAWTIRTRAAEPVQDASRSLAGTVAFLAQEIPAWHVEHRCYSCHNNGDAVRALILARAHGFDIGASIADTLAFLSAPNVWSANSKGGPLDDQPLARIQFASALADAVASGLAPASALAEAALLVAADQKPEGSWQLDPSNSLGSPATYGTALATWSARRVLIAGGLERFREHVERADRWLREAPLAVTPDAAAVLLGLGSADDPPARRQRSRAVAFLVDTQGPDGGWGPYPNVRAEPFDTAVAVLGLLSQPPTEAIGGATARGRAYLLATMQPDGTWLETTRPPGQRSYAQLISTTGWAVIALLK